MYENLKKMSHKCKACNIPTKLDKHEMELFWLQEFRFKKTSYKEATRFGMCKRKLEDYKRKIICHVSGPRLCHGKYCYIHVGKDYMYLWLQPHYKSLSSLRNKTLWGCLHCCKTSLSFLVPNNLFRCVEGKKSKSFVLFLELHHW
jgi:hypothetical protein